MPYIGKDGTVHNSRPWSRRLTELFWGLIAFFVLFFKTLTEPFASALGNAQSNNGNNRRGGPGGGGGGGPSGGPRRPGDGGGPRKIGRIKTIADCNIPMAGGG